MIDKINTSLEIGNVRIRGGFWGKYINLTKDVIIPYQWKILNDQLKGVELSHSVKNFKIAAGMCEGEFYGNSFQDTDLYKWLESVGYILTLFPNTQLEKISDWVIDIIIKAQESNGYLNTYYTIKEPNKKWANLCDGLELYCAGHMIEAAVSYYKATGKRNLLLSACRLADHIYSVFGKNAGKKKGYLAHAEIEIALVKLYRVTGEERYLYLSKYLVDRRGKDIKYFRKLIQTRSDKENRAWDELGLKYCQSHIPVRKQVKAEGHCVMATYLYSAMVDIAIETGEYKLIKVCKKIWENIVLKRMYITGGIGSTSFGESFTFDYDLPNDTMYCETCASVGLIFFAHRMLQIETDIFYSDIMEKVFYNAFLSGLSTDGEKYFYVNPLEVWPEASKKTHIKNHVRTNRQSWYKCACCPTNITRLLSSFSQYIYSYNRFKNEIYIHLYNNNEANISLSQNKVKIVQKTQYPWHEEVTLKIYPEKKSEFSIFLRIPGWTSNPKVFINNKINDLSDNKVINGYLGLKRIWRKGDTIELVLPMTIKRMKSNPNVRVNIGKVALQRGPIIYCLEEVDNGQNLHEIFLPRESKLRAEFDGNLLGGAVVLIGEGQRYDDSGWQDFLYEENIEPRYRPIQLKFVPYYLWANRGSGEMIVWINEV